jgi:hypothetical protein
LQATPPRRIVARVDERTVMDTPQDMPHGPEAGEQEEAVPDLEVTDLATANEVVGGRKAGKEQQEYLIVGPPPPPPPPPPPSR